MPEGVIWDASGRPIIVDKDKDIARRAAQGARSVADASQQNFAQAGTEADAARQYLQDLARGKNSVAAEQLRQGLQQNVAAQRSLAASASPANAAMAFRSALMNAGKLGAGATGQAAVAGLQERNQAQMQLNEMLKAKREQELQAMIASRNQQLTASGQLMSNPEKSGIQQGLDYALPIIQTGAQFGMMSDRRVKKNVEDADDESRKIVDGLKAYRYTYRDEKHGKGSQYGIMAQDLERAGLGHAVVETPEGKAVHGGKLAGANTAMIASLGKRIAALEGKRG